MLNLFPIQWLALLAYFVLRLFVGGILLFLARSHFHAYRELVITSTCPFFPKQPLPVILIIVIETVLGTMFLVGIFTQVACLGLVLLSLTMLWWRNRFTHPSIPSALVYIILIGCSLSLFITGAGMFAFDLPI